MNRIRGLGDGFDLVAYDLALLECSVREGRWRYEPAFDELLFESDEGI